MILSEYVADTHALLWYLQNSPRLGTNASAAFDAADQGQAQIVLSSIALAELYYLIVKHKLPFNYAQELARLQAAPQFVFVDFKASDTLLFDHLTAIPEMHDRIIAGVALTRNCPCLTRDFSITSSGLVHVVW
jgi:PIN domain nuclease of toxin-antitoxin system